MVPLVLPAWLRCSNSGSARGTAAFLTEALALMPAHWKLRTGRADSGFFENAQLSFLEARGIPYIVDARLTQTVKRKAAGLTTWPTIDENYAWARFSLQLQGCQPLLQATQNGMCSTQYAPSDLNRKSDTPKRH